MFIYLCTVLIMAKLNYTPALMAFVVEKRHKQTSPDPLPPPHLWMRRHILVGYESHLICDLGLDLWHQFWENLWENLISKYAFQVKKGGGNPITYRGRRGCLSGQQREQQRESNKGEEISIAATNWLIEQRAVLKRVTPLRSLRVWGQY